jgi:hypothetical protein
MIQNKLYFFQVLTLHTKLTFVGTFIHLHNEYCQAMCKDWQLQFEKHLVEDDHQIQPFTTTEYQKIGHMFLSLLKLLWLPIWNGGEGGSV